MIKVLQYALTSEKKIVKTIHYNISLRLVYKFKL